MYIMTNYNPRKAIIFLIHALIWVNLSKWTADVILQY